MIPYSEISKVMEKNCDNCRNLKQLKDNSWLCAKGFGGIYSEECPSWEPKELETCTYDDKTYILLRPITIKSLILDGARDEDVEYLSNIYPIFVEISLQKAVAFCSRCLDKMRWMREKGYWRVEEEKKDAVKGEVENMYKIEYACPFCFSRSFQIRHGEPATFKAFCYKCNKKFEVEIND